MTTVTTALPASAHYRVSFAHTLRSEWLKLWTLRSTWWILGATVVAMALIALGAASFVRLIATDPEVATEVGGSLTSIDAVTSGSQFAQLVVAVLGVLVISNEYSSGMIRTSFSAGPKRLPTLWAKAIIVGVVVFVTGLIGVAVSYAVTYPMLSSVDQVPDLTDPVSLRVISGTALFLALVALMSLGIGTLLRHTAGGIFTVVALLFVVPLITSLLPWAWVDDVERYLPSNAATAFLSTSDLATTGIDVLTPVQGLLVLLAWVVVPLAAAAVVLKARDA